MKSVNTKRMRVRKEVKRGRERPHRSAIAATVDTALVAPAHVLPENRVNTRPVPTEYQDWPQLRPERGQP